MAFLEPASPTHVSGDLVTFNIKGPIPIPPGSGAQPYYYFAIWDANGVGNFKLPNPTTPLATFFPTTTSTDGSSFFSLLQAGQQFAMRTVGALDDGNT